LIVALQTGEDQVEVFSFYGRGKRARRAERIEFVELIVRDVNSAVSALREGSLVSNPMSDSRIHAPPSTIASGASFAGTCLTQTPIFKTASS
jgi:hypothetical protein